MPGAPDLSVVVPVYDEQDSLRELVARVTDVCAATGVSFEILFVDDGSRDQSWSIISELAATNAAVRGVRFRRNRGKSAALASGFHRTAGRYVLTMDADLQDDPAEIPALIAKLEEGYDLVSGWKVRRQDPLSKTIPSRFFNAITRIMSGIRLHDFNCGLKIYRSEVVKTVKLYGELHRYIPLLASNEGFDRIAELPVKHHPRKYGRTKFGLERYIRGFLDLLTVLFLTRFAARPMHFFGTLGTMAFVLGFLISLYLSVDKLVYGNPIGGRPLLILGAVLLLLGAQLFLTGLLGEIFVRPGMEASSTESVAETIN